MKLLALSLRSFRNYPHAELELSPQVNQFYGANAQGKTNLLEALYLFITGRSFRTRRLAELIRWGDEAFQISLSFRVHETDHSLKILGDSQQRRLFHNGAPCASLSELLGLIPGVIFAPDDQALISGCPATRRRFLDLHLSQIDPEYLRHLARYHRSLRQRNALLRQRALSSLSVWEEQMAPSAHYITEVRFKTVAQLQTFASHYQGALSERREELKLELESSLQPSDSASTFRDRLISQRTQDARLGYTTLGPQRDELRILINEREARLFSSEGQKACAAIALRLAQRASLKQQGQEPILLIDDVGARLDRKRRDLLYSELFNETQSFLAAPFPVNTQGALFLVANGSVQEARRAPTTHPMPQQDSREEPQVDAALH